QLIYILTLLTYLKKVEKENISFNKITTQHLIIIFCSFFMFLGLLFLKQAVPFFSIPVFALIILPLLGTIIYGLLMLLFQKEFCKKIIKELLN
ncbi:hypothetical protein D3I06_13605, partial [Enterococcus faecium]|nr:hypothetical protein [Enterococcus faecium]